MHRLPVKHWNYGIKYDLVCNISEINICVKLVLNILCLYPELSQFNYNCSHLLIIYTESTCQIFISKVNNAIKVSWKSNGLACNTKYSAVL